MRGEMAVLAILWARIRVIIEEWRLAHGLGRVHWICAFHWDVGVDSRIETGG